MKRYSYQPEYTTYEGDFGSSIDLDDEGEYVLHSEAQARIEALEAALRGMLSISSHTMRTSPDVVCGECDAIDAARAALSIKVGETKDARD